MLYKTMVLELLQQRPEMHDRLRSSRTLLAALDLYAGQLKCSHEAWTEHLSRTQPNSDPGQTASAALEIALRELEGCLPPASPPDDNDPISIDGAMAFLRRHTPPA